MLQNILNPNFIDSNQRTLSSPTTDLEHYLNSLTEESIIKQVGYYHQSIPGYHPTPLINLNSLSNNLGVASIQVKDESQRFDLNAFKMLGASFAVAEILAQKIQLKAPYTFEQIISKMDSYKKLVLATTTDGNHGRAVAWCAKQFGCQAKVYMPKNSSPARLNAIKKYTPDAQITDYNYDDTVSMVAQLASDNGWQLVQDTAWGGYTEIPNNIMRGYFSLITEFESQSPNVWPSHVFLQAGVGSMAAALAAYFVKHKKPTPKIILVEPNNAPCFYESIKINDGKPHQAGNLETVMAGLACGLPSKTAWEILSRYAYAFIKCDDEVTVTGMKRYATPNGNDTAITSGESAAVTLGVLEHVMGDNTQSEIRKQLQLNGSSNVLLFSTEGDTDPVQYRKLVNDR